MKGTPSSLVLIIAALLLAPHAVAQKPDKVLARKHYKAGKQAYAASEFRRAAKEFSTGYLHDPKPAFLINIAQSYRKADDLEQAAHYYREYLRVAPESKLAPQVEGLIKEIEAEIKQKEPKEPPPPLPPPAIAVTQPPPPPPPRPRDKPLYTRWWFWAGVGAVVVAGVSAGIYAGTRGPGYVESGGLGSVSW